jgi:hypothetical protein
MPSAQPRMSSKGIALTGSVGETFPKSDSSKRANIDPW